MEGSVMKSFYFAIICAFLGFNLGFAKEPTILKNQGNASGASSIASDAKTSLMHNIGILSYDSIKKTAEFDSESKALNLMKPRQFSQDGFYIWQNSNDIWCIYYISKSPTIFTVTISARDTIDIITVEGNPVHLNPIECTKLELLPVGKVTTFTIKFRTLSSYIDFDFRINGQYIPDRIHLGEQTENPTHVPFRLACQLTSDTTKGRKNDHNNVAWPENDSTHQLMKKSRSIQVNDGKIGGGGNGGYVPGRRERTARGNVY